MLTVKGTVRESPFTAWHAPVPAGRGAMSADEYRPVSAGLEERIDVDPDDVERGLGKLVLTIVEFVRQLLERQAVRRMASGSLSDTEVERIGVALMRLDEKVGEMAARFGLRRGGRPPGPRPPGPPPWPFP